jgi:hypothetical protein
MSTPWTPGPWEISGQKTIRTKRHDGRLDGWVARANWQNGVANARLIAAAPEMAEVLERMAAPFAKWDDGALPEALALLARIKGEAS